MHRPGPIQDSLVSEVLISGWRFKASLLLGLVCAAGYLLAFAIGGRAPV